MTQLLEDRDDLPTRQDERWWRHGVLYEVYPWSFADADGDGIGDLRGVIERLDHVAALGADAVWLTPWYPSPLVDGGYDVSDYCAIDPRLGTLDDADELIARAHALGLRVVIDMVANHSSDQHPWFREALAAPAGDASRARYIFRDGRGPDGSEPPNNWLSAFGDGGWTRTADADGRPGQWYFHTFSPEQPDLNWAHAPLREEMLTALAFWYERGIDGVRIDAAPAMAKADGLPDADYDLAAGFDSRGWEDSPHWDVPGVHDLLREWRTVADSFDPPRMLVVESVVSSPRRLAAYLREDEAHCAFNFDFLYAGWNADRMRSAVSSALEAHAEVGAMPTWALGSHDETRIATRFGLADTRAGNKTFENEENAAASAGLSEDIDEEQGRRTARAAALVQLALPGSPCLFQGDELGLPEVLDLPESALRTDPVWTRSGGENRGRAGCRVPLPWQGQEPPFGFSPAPGQPWIPQPSVWRDLTVATQDGRAGSTLELYRAAIRLRRELGMTATEDFSWTTQDGPVLGFRHGGLLVLANTGDAGVAIDEGSVLLSSGDRPDGVLPAGATVWLRAEA